MVAHRMEVGILQIELNQNRNQEPTWKHIRNFKLRADLLDGVSVGKVTEQLISEKEIDSRRGSFFLSLSLSLRHSGRHLHLILIGSK